MKFPQERFVIPTANYNYRRQARESFNILSKWRIQHLSQPLAK